MSTLASKLAHMRETRGLSMTELSRVSGVSVGTISLIESGKVTNSKRDTLQKLAQALHVDVEYFIDEGARTPLELMADKLPQDVIEFILAEDSMPYLVLAQSAWKSKEISESAFQWALELLRKAQKGGEGE